MKRIFVAGMLVFASIANSQGSEQRVINVQIFGTGPAVDAAAYQLVRTAIAHELSQGTLKKFVVRGFGIEGGFDACVEFNLFDRNAIDRLLSQLKTIKPNENTSYNLALGTSCP